MLNNLWQLQDAKNKFSSLVDKAKSSGPQIVYSNRNELSCIHFVLRVIPPVPILFIGDTYFFKPITDRYN